MRLYARVWGIGRIAMESASLGGYGCGRLEYIHSAVAHATRSAIFPRAGTIRPERWRDDPFAQERFRASRIFPLEAGHGFGVGAAFAMMEATLLLAMIQQKYHLEVVPGHPIESSRRLRCVPNMAFA